MKYIEIGGRDCSKYCNELKVTVNKKYNAQTNAVGDTVVDFIKSKVTLEVGFIQIDSNVDTQMIMEEFCKGNSLLVKYLNPTTNEVEQIICFVADSTFDYYTIRDEKVTIKPFKVKLVEL